MSKSLFDLFPVPKYLNFPAVGLDICHDSIKFVELVSNPHLGLGKYGTKVVGPIKNPADADVATIRALSEISREYGIKAAHVSLPEEQSYFLKLHLPSMKKKDIRGSIELQLEEYIPYSPADIIFDYEIIKGGQTASEGIDVSVSVIPKTVVERYVNLLREADIMPISFEVESQSMSRAAVSSTDDSVVMVVNIGKTDSVLSIVSKGTVWLSHTMKIGGDFFTKTVQACMNLKTDDAEKTKMTKGLSRSPENEDCLFSLAPAISSLRDEIIKYYWYWNAHKTGNIEKEIDRVILSGHEATINSITEYLSVSLGLRVVLSNPWINILSFDKTIPEISANHSLEYTTAIGLALKGTGTIHNQ